MLSPFSLGAGFKHCIYLYGKLWKGKNVFEMELAIEHHMVSHTEVTNHSPFFLFFSERDNWERHVPDFCFPRNRGEQAGSPPGARFPGYRKIRWALTVLAAAMCPPPCTSQHVSLLGPWVSNSWPSGLAPGVGSLYVGKAGFLHLRPWVDFVKEQEQHRLSFGEMSFAFYISIGYFYMMGALSVNAAGSPFQSCCFCK